MLIYVYSNTKIIPKQKVVFCTVLGEIANFGLGIYL